MRVRAGDDGSGGIARGWASVIIPAQSSIASTMPQTDGVRRPLKACTELHATAITTHSTRVSVGVGKSVARQVFDSISRALAHSRNVEQL